MKSLALATFFLYAFIQTAFCQVIIVPPSTTYSGGHYYQFNASSPIQYVQPKHEYSTPGYVIDFSPRTNRSAVIIEIAPSSDDNSGIYFIDED